MKTLSLETVKHLQSLKARPSVTITLPIYLPHLAGQPERPDSPQESADAGHRASGSRVRQARDDEEGGLVMLTRY
ncbi:hypothetical protein [Deinococcus rubellus]|uniref:hypothetical protein n=1 Tax=Deinococcus rubellus TaxID=1889240 RepID=UPI0031E52176